MKTHSIETISVQSVPHSFRITHWDIGAYGRFYKNEAAAAKTMYEKKATTNRQDRKRARAHKHTYAHKVPLYKSKPFESQTQYIVQ